MFWVLVVVGIVVLQLVVLVSYGIWLWHKASDLLFELGRIGDQAGELGELIASVGAERAVE